MIPVSVVVPTIGRIDLLRRCLASVVACEPAADEIVVVDQSGGDDVQALGAQLDDVRVRIIAGRGRGISSAMNQGLGAARHDVVLVTHDDCTVDPGWVGIGRALAATYPGAIVTGRVLAPEGADYVPSTKDDPRPHDYTGRVMSGVLYPANMVLDRTAVQAVGGFDERPGLRVAGEDNDLCYRWLVDGRTFRYEPELVVWHHDWRTPDKLVRTHIAYAHGQGAFYAKHLVGGDRRVLGMLWWDLRHGVRATVRGLVRRQPRWQEPYREMVVSLVVGIARALPEAWRLRSGPSGS